MKTTKRCLHAHTVLPVGGWWRAISVCKLVAGACRRGNWRQTTGTREVEKRKRDKTWNDVAAAQKRGVELQGLSEATRHQLESTKKGFVNWLELHSDHIVVDPREGPTLEVMKQYAGHIFKFRVRHSSAGREGRSESSNNHVRKRRRV